MIEVFYCRKASIGHGYAVGSERFDDYDTFIIWLDNAREIGPVLITEITRFPSGRSRTADNSGAHKHED